MRRATLAIFSIVLFADCARKKDETQGKGAMMLSVEAPLKLNDVSSRTTSRVKSGESNANSASCIGGGTLASWEAKVAVAVQAGAPARHVIVLYPDERDVCVNGYRAGKTNDTIKVPGTQEFVFDLGPLRDYQPESKTASGGLRTNPVKIIFEPKPQ